MGEAIRSAFREWNHMLIDQQQWDAKREARNQDFELQKVELEERGKDRMLQREQTRLSMQGERQQQKLNQMKLDDEINYRAPKEQSIYDFMGRDFLGNEDQIKATKDVFRHLGEDIRFNRADGIIHTGDDPLPISDQDMSKYLPVLDRIRTGWKDTPMESKAKLTEALALQGELQTKYAKEKNNKRKWWDAQKTFKALQAVKEDIKTLAPMASDEGALRNYADNVNRYRTDAAIASSRGMHTYAKFLNQRAEDFLGKENAWRKGMATRDKVTLKTHPIYDNNPGSVNFGKFKFNRTFRSDDDIGALLAPNMESITKPVKDPSGGDDQTLTEAQARSAITNSYDTIVKSLKGKLTMADFTDKVDTHNWFFEKISQGKAGKEKGINQNAWATSQAQTLINITEDMYQDTKAAYTAMTYPEAYEIAKQIPFLASLPELTNNNSKELLLQWWEDTGYKKAVVDMLVLNYGVTDINTAEIESRLYLPNETTKMGGKFK